MARGEGDIVWTHWDGTKLFVKLYWKSLVVLLWPVMCLPVFLFQPHPMSQENEKYRCLFVYFWMCGYWITKVSSIATAVIPLVVSPFMGIIGAKEFCLIYLAEHNALLFGLCGVYGAIDHTQLHRRVFYMIMVKFRSSLRLMLFGVMLTSALLSILVLNRYAITMMIPLVTDLMRTFQESGVESLNLPDEENPKAKPDEFVTVFYLGAAFGTTIGGLFFVMSDETQLTSVAIIEMILSCTIIPFSFERWLIFNIITGVIYLVAIWMILSHMFLNKTKNVEMIEKTLQNEDDIKNAIIERYDSLGYITWREFWTFFVIVALLFIWSTRKVNSEGFGWARSLVYVYHKPDKKKIFIRFSAPTYLCIFFLAILPKNLDCLNFCRGSQPLPVLNTQSILPWKIFNSHMFWGGLFYIGAGIGIAHIFKITGLQYLISQKFSFLEGKNEILVLISICVFATIFTEFVTNIYTVNILTPIVVAVGQGMRVNPLYFAIPATLSIAYSFTSVLGSKTYEILFNQINLSKRSLFISGLIIKFIVFSIMLILYIGLNPYFFSVDKFTESMDARFYLKVQKKNTTLPG